MLPHVTTTLPCVTNTLAKGTTWGNKIRVKSPGLTEIVVSLRRKRWNPECTQMCSREDPFDEMSGMLLCPLSSDPTKCLVFHSAKLLSCLTLCDPMNWGRPDSSAHERLQASILERAAISSSWESFWPRNRTRISYSLPHWQAGSLLLVPGGKPTVPPVNKFWLLQLVIPLRKPV